MPELPEVETVVRDLRAAGLEGRTIRTAHVRWPRMVTPLAPAAFIRRAKGQRIIAIHRRAKYIVISLSGGDTLLVHLRMTGRFQFVTPGSSHDAHEHITLMLDDGRELRYHDTRKFGRWVLTSTPETILGLIGPEPLDPDLRFDQFSERLTLHNRSLKPLLLDQRFIAGIGNIYADEALWEARLHPLRTSRSLTREEQQRLFKAIRTVLRRGIRNHGTTLGRGQVNFYSVGGRRGRNQDGLKVFRLTGDPCPRCRAPIQRMQVGQRSTHICPKCQK